MDLGHRLIKRSFTPWQQVLFRIQRPLSILIPLLILVLSFFSVRQLFGLTWDSQGLSLVFVPVVGNFVKPILEQPDNQWLSILILSGYAITPLTIYVYVRFVTKRHLPAIVAGLLLILPLIPISFQYPTRLILAVKDGDGGHILGLAFIPILAVFFQQFLRQGKQIWFLFTILMGLTVGLISFFALIVCNIFLLVITLAEGLVGLSRVKFQRYLATSALLLGIILVIYNLAIVEMVTSESGKTAIAVVTSLLPLLFFLVPVLGTFAFLIFDRRPGLQPLFISCTLTFIFGAMNLVRVALVDIPLLDQSRYSAELSLALAFLTGIGVMWIFELLRQGVFMEKYPALYTKRRLTAVIFASATLCILTGLILFIPRSF